MDCMEPRSELLELIGSYITEELQGDVPNVGLRPSPVWETWLDTRDSSLEFGTDLCIQWDSDEDAHRRGSLRRARVGENRELHCQGCHLLDVGWKIAP